MDETYLIWSNEHRAWWRSGMCGYTTGLRDAGRYSRQQAMRICRAALPSACALGTISEIPVRLQDVHEFMARQLVPSCVFGGGGS